MPCAHLEEKNLTSENERQKLKPFPPQETGPRPFAMTTKEPTGVYTNTQLSCK